MEIVRLPGQNWTYLHMAVARRERDSGCFAKCAPEEGVLFRGGGGGGEWEKSKEVVPFVLSYLRAGPHEKCGKNQRALREPKGK